MNDYKRKLQLKILEIVKVIDKICIDNNIEYYLIYGSVLGAVRHKGFIPWDDDFDIGMTYENYIKFQEVCDEQLDTKKYFLQRPEKSDLYLRHIYGDYMKIPSAEQIKAKEHTPYVLDLEHSYDEYLKLNKKGKMKGK